MNEVTPTLSATHPPSQGPAIVHTLPELLQAFMAQSGSVFAHTLTESACTRFTEILNRPFTIKRRDGSLLVEVTIRQLLRKIDHTAFSGFYLSNEAVFYVLGVDYFVDLFSKKGILLAPQLKEEIRVRCDQCTCATLILHEASPEAENVVTLALQSFNGNLERYDIHQNAFHAPIKVREGSLILCLSKDGESKELLTKERVRLGIGGSPVISDPAKMHLGALDWLFHTSRVADPQASLNHRNFQRLISDQVKGEHVDRHALEASFQFACRGAAHHGGLARSIWTLFLEVWEQQHSLNPAALPLLFLNAYPLLKNHLQAGEWTWLVDSILAQAPVPEALQSLLFLLRSDADPFFALLSSSVPYLVPIEGHCLAIEPCSRQAVLSLLNRSDLERFLPHIAPLRAPVWNVETFLF